MSYVSTVMDETDLKKLEQRVDELIALVERLHNENKTLRDREAGLLAERATLVERTELARTRVESMISRLKAMEHE